MSSALVNVSAHGDYLFMVHGTPESMAAIVDNLTIELGDERDQITTRADSRFAALRSRVLNEIRGLARPSEEAGTPS